MNEEPKLKNETVIFVNKTKINVDKDQLLGNEILQMAGFNPQDFDLFLKDNSPDGRKIEPNETVKIKNGLHFHAIRREVPYG